jgi:RNA polymerase sigma factor (sigma-70 family)
VNAWARKTISRFAIDRLRKQGRFQFLAEPEEQPDYNYTEPLEPLIYAEERGQLHEWLENHATAEERALILARSLAEETLESLSEQMGCSIATVHRRHHRALASLKQFLTHETP